MPELPTSGVNGHVLSAPALQASMSMLSFAPAATMLGWFASIATAGSFCLFIENGDGGLPAETRVSPPTCAVLLGADSAINAATAIVKTPMRTRMRSSSCGDLAALPQSAAGEPLPESHFVNARNAPIRSVSREFQQLGCEERPPFEQAAAAVAHGRAALDPLRVAPRRLDEEGTGNVFVQQFRRCARVIRIGLSAAKDQCR